MQTPADSVQFWYNWDIISNFRGRSQFLSRKSTGFYFLFLFSLFSPYAHLISVASEITLLGARQIYLFTYLKTTHPLFFILATGTQFCSHIKYILSVAFRVLLQWLLLQLAGVLTLVTFHLFPSCLFIRCLLCFSRPTESCFHVTSNFSTQYWFSLKSWWTQVALVQLLCLHSCLHQSWLLCSDSCPALTTAWQLVFNNTDWCWLMLP